MDTLIDHAPSEVYPPLQLGRRQRGCWFWAGWEPDRYYRRIGARATLFFGNGDWIADWRTRLKSDECLEAAREAGASILITRFAKGFGPAVDGRDWDTLEKFVQRAHAKDLKVWGYLQGQSIFGEFLFRENPDAVNWIALAYDGTRRTWGGTYNRFAPCLSSEGYRGMVETLVGEGLSRVKLDGLHMDNSYYAHCYCPRCKKLFREWLDARGDLERITGIESAEFVEPPPLSPEADILPDPLAILWMEFGVQQRLKFVTAIRRKVREIAAQAHLTGNPAFMRSFASRLTHGYDPALEHQAFDSVCVENGNRPRYAKGVLFTQADKHLMAEAGSLRAWVTSWSPPPKGSAGYEPPDDAQSIWAGLAEEFSFQRAFLGNNWALRPVGDGGGLLMDCHSDRHVEFERAVQFFQELENALGDEPRRQWGELVVYVNTQSLAVCPTSDCHVLQAFLARMFLHRIPFKVVFQKQAFPGEAKTLLVIGQRCLSSAELERLADFANRDGCELWMVGGCGTHDEWVVPRGASVRREILDRPRIRQIDLPLKHWVERGVASKKYFQGLSPSFTAEGVAGVSAVLGELNRRLRVQVRAPEGLLANVELQGEDRLLIHLRDLRNDRNHGEAGEVRLLIRGEVCDVRATTPDWDRELAFTDQDGLADISLPAFRHYACISLPVCGLDTSFPDAQQGAPSICGGSYQKSASPAPCEPIGKSLTPRTSATAIL